MKSDEIKRALLITFANAKNYGACLQTEATISVFGDYNIEFVILNYRNPNEAANDQLFAFNRLCSLLSNIKQFCSKLVFYHFLRSGDGFAEYHKSLPFTTKYDYRTINQFDREYNLDFIVIGSDQVWNLDLTGGEIDRILFGCFSDKPKVSFSSSAGNHSFSKEELESIIPILTNYKAVSVRETYLAEQLSSYGINAKTVLDPTLMLSSVRWRALVNDSAIRYKVNEPYVFVFMVEGRKWNSIRCFVNIVKNTYGLKVVYLANRDFAPSDVDYFLRDVTPYEWISLIDNAFFVITNSFHCTVFSTLFHKAFAVIKPRGYMRIANFLSAIRYPDRMVNSEEELKCTLSRKIDYESVDGIISEMRNQSDGIIVDIINSLLIDDESESKNE